MKERMDNGSMTVDFKNIKYLEVEEVKGEYVVYYTYRPKLKLEKILLRKTFSNLNELKKFFNSHNMFMLGNYLINVENIEVIAEIKNELILPSVEIGLYTSNFPPVVILTTLKQWQAFKNLRLV